MIAGAWSRTFSRVWSVRVAAGAILGGTIIHDQRTHDVSPGWLTTVSGSRQWRFGVAELWFASASVTLGMSRAKTQETTGGMEGESVSLGAADFRVGALAGLTLAERYSPYVLVRGFGGPVSWQLDGQDITGTDQHHYQLGAGMTVQLPFAATVLVDASFLGERSLSVGLGLAL
jgi:hypothetical protein